MIGIYRITRKKTGQKYIGQSKNVWKRIKQHFHYPSPVSYIDNSIKLHGVTEYTVDILCTFDEYDKDVLNDAEEFFIAAEGTYENPHHYNLTPGGETGIEFHTLDAMKKISKSANTTGFFRVTKIKSDSFSQGFSYVYQYYDEDGNPKRIRSKNLDDLQEKVQKKGLPFFKIDKIMAKKTLEFEKNKFKLRYKPTNTGFFRVHKTKPNGGKSVFRYTFRDKNGKNKSINSISIRRLKKKIEKNGLVWKIIDEEQAKKTWEAEDE